MSSTEIIADQDPSARLAAKRTRGRSRRWVGPAGHLAAERTRLGAAEWRHFDARPVGATIGAEISGIDLTVELADDVVAELRRALLDFKVLFLRDQPISAADHVAFARRFGELEVHPFIPANAEHPELVRFEKSADVGGYENTWHHDVTWRETPSMGAILHAIQVPPTGGDTLFCDMAAAYDGLEPELRARIDQLSATHDFMKAFSGQVPPERRDEMRAAYPVVEHPVVRTHPETGRRSLYVNAVFTSGIVGLDPDESEDLLLALCAEADEPEYQCRFRWEADSIAFWDNRAVQHYAASDYWPDVRIMHRASIVGDRPR